MLPWPKLLSCHTPPPFCTIQDRARPHPQIVKALNEEYFNRDTHSPRHTVMIAGLSLPFGHTASSKESCLTLINSETPKPYIAAYSSYNPHYTSPEQRTQNSPQLKRGYDAFPSALLPGLNKQRLLCSSGVCEP